MEARMGARNAYGCLCLLMVAWESTWDWVCEWFLFIVKGCGVTDDHAGRPLRFITTMQRELCEPIGIQAIPSLEMHDGPIA